MADLGVFKPQLERWVSKKTGREFAIDGTFSVDLSAHAVIIAEDVRIKNAAWADNPEMVEIGRAEVRLDFWSLFNGPVLIELIDVDDVNIRLVQREDLGANWELPIETAKGSGEEESDAVFKVLFDLIDIDRVSILYDAFDRDNPLDLRIESLEQRHRQDDYLELELQATLGDRKIGLRGAVGTLQALLAGQDIHYSFEGELDTFEIESSGWVDDIARPRRPSVQFSARGPDVKDLTRLLAVGEEGEGDIDITGSLMPEVDGPLILNIEGNIGKTNIEASGAISDLQDLEDVDIDLLAAGPDLGRILRLAGVHDIREAPFMINIDAARHGPMLVIEQGNMMFADAEFDVSARMPNFPSVDDASIAVQISGPDIERFRYVTRLPGKSTGAFSLGFELLETPSGREVITLEFETSFGLLSASGVLDDAPDYIGSTFDVQLKGDNLSLLGKAHGIRNLPDKPFFVAGSAELAADSIRFTGPLAGNIDDIAVSLQGLIALNSGIKGSKFSFGLAGPDLVALTGMFGVSDGVPNEPYDVNGDLYVHEEGYRIQGVAGTIGSSTINVDGLVVAANGLAGSRVSFDASGPAFEEIIDELGVFELRPGAFALSGKIALLSDRIEFEDIIFNRKAGEISVNLQLGLPVSRRWANFDLHANGSDIRSVIRGIDGYEAEEGPFDIDARGQLRSENLSIDTFKVGIGDARMQARGDLDFGADGSSTRFSFSGNIPSLAQFGYFDKRRLHNQAITWNAQITGGNGFLAIEDLNVKLGESDINGSIRYTKGDVPNLNIAIQSESIVFGPLLENQDLETVAEPKFADGRLIPDVAVPFDAMRKLNAFIDVEIGELRRDSVYMRNVDLVVALQDGILDVQNASFDAYSGWIKARGKVDPAGGAGKASLEIVARDFKLQLLRTDPDDAMWGDLDIKLDSSGADARSLASNATGMIFLDTRGGLFSNSQTLQVIYGDMLTEIINVINPFYKADPYTKFQCVVVGLKIDEGKVTSAPSSFIGTDKMRLSLTSTVDLSSEALDVNIRMTSQKGLKVSSGELFNSYVKVTGTLAAPRLAVDEAGVLVSGGAAIATGGLSILAKMAWDRLSRSGDPCVAAAEQGKKILVDRMPGLSDGT